MSWDASQTFSYSTSLLEDPSSNFSHNLALHHFDLTHHDNELSILHGLNTSQIDAVRGSDTAILFAGPGSGKTRTLTARVDYLLNVKHIPDSSILVLTFSNRAAKELKSRVNNPFIHVFTFHSLASFWLRRNGVSLGIPPDFEVLDSNDSTALFKEAAAAKLADFCHDHVEYMKTKKKKLNLKTHFKTEISTIQKIYDSFRVNEVPLPAYLMIYGTNLEEKQFKEIFDLYAEKKVNAKALDFDDLLIYGKRLFEIDPAISGRYKHILVDEFQDTSKIQMEILLALTRTHKSLWVVGDLNQQIYSWRNAMGGENLATFARTFDNPTNYSLDINYRSTSRIWDFAKNIIRGSKYPVDNILTHTSELGPKTSIIGLETDQEEATYLAFAIEDLVKKGARYGDVVLIVRTAYQSLILEKYLRNKSIPSRILSGASFYERSEIKDCISLMKIAHNPHDLLSLNRMFNTPARGLGDAAQKEFDRAVKSSNLSPWQVYKNLFSQKKSVKGFIAAIDKAAESFASENSSLSTILLQIVELVEYRAYLEKKDAELSIEKIENIMALADVFKTFQTSCRLAAQEVNLNPPNLSEMFNLWLESVALDSKVDPKVLRNKDVKLNMVSIITAHSAKGLEWPIVFVTNSYDGSFPLPIRPSASIEHLQETNPTLYRELYDREQEKHLEEERRVFYVAATRAEAMLTFTFAHRVYKFGEIKEYNSSRFLSFARGKPNYCTHYQFAHGNEEGLDYVINVCSRNQLKTEAGDSIPFVFPKKPGIVSDPPALIKEEYVESRRNTIPDHFEEIKPQRHRVRIKTEIKEEIEYFEDID